MDLNNQIFLFALFLIIVIPALSWNLGNRYYTLSPAFAGQTNLFVFLIFVFNSASPVVSLNDQKFTKKQFEKYNAEEIIACHFDFEILSRLKDEYHNFYIPNIIADLLYEESINIESMAFSEEGDFILMINPLQMPIEEWQDKDLVDLKNNDGGLSLIGWYIHPNLMKKTPFYERYILGKEVFETNFYTEKTFYQIEDDQERYLVSILDLTVDNIDYLKKIRRIAMDKLIFTYGVDPKKVKFYFHFPYPKDTLSLHLHIRVDQEMPELEKAKSFDLDEIIELLENGVTIEEIILKRQQQDSLHEDNEKCIYFNRGYEETLDTVKISYKTVRNHFRNISLCCTGHIIR